MAWDLFDHLDLLFTVQQQHSGYAPTSYSCSMPSMAGGRCISI
eukprot:COSAG05_NODE_9696_length_607_cov_1.480315_1_plen_42_part_01